MTDQLVPDAVARAEARAAQRGFSYSCNAEVGRLLATLAAGLRDGARVLELGTGSGYGLAWLSHGLRSRDDVRVMSVEQDGELHAAVADDAWPPFVSLVHADAVEHLSASGERFDLVFADAPAGKVTGFDQTLAALAVGGMLVLDDMDEQPGNPVHAEVWPQIRALEERVLGDPELQAVRLDWGGGVILATRLAPPTRA